MLVPGPAAAVPDQGRLATPTTDREPPVHPAARLQHMGGNTEAVTQGQRSTARCALCTMLARHVNRPAGNLQQGRTGKPIKLSAEKC